MTDTEKRRMDLLAQTRNMYQDRRQIPAVHPRYGNVYRNLYGSNGMNGEEEKTNKRESSFRVRVILALFIFAIYASADYNGMTVGDVTQEDILQVLSYNIELK